MLWRCNTFWVTWLILLWHRRGFIELELKKEILNFDSLILYSNLNLNSKLIYIIREALNHD